MRQFTLIAMALLLLVCVYVQGASMLEEDVEALEAEDSDFEEEDYKKDTRPDCLKPADYDLKKYAVWDQDKCVKENPGTKKCTKSGPFYYPSCRSGYRSFGPTACTAWCPSGMMYVDEMCTTAVNPPTKPTITCKY